MENERLPMTDVQNSTESKFIKPPFYMAIAGNIGVGKTTMTERLGARFNLKTYFERVIDNPYLDEFYHDMHRWSFNLQVFFLSNRFRDQQVISASPVPCIQDRTIYEDAEIFAYILHRQGFMSDRDYENYCELFDIMTQFLRKPDLIVYLKASAWTLISRIRKRGREYEKKITTDYLYDLNQAYDRWIEKCKDQCNVLEIDADRLDLDRHPQLINEVYDQVKVCIDQYHSGN